MIPQQRPSLLASIGLLILRLAMGLYMITHGWSKLKLLTAGDFDSFADPIGLGSGASLVLIVFAEVACASLVAAGLLTRIAAVPVVIAMAVAALVVHAGDPWTMGGGAALYKAGDAESWASKEPALLFLSGYLTLVFTGPGRFSLDLLIWKAGTKPSS